VRELTEEQERLRAQLAGPTAAVAREKTA